MCHLRYHTSVSGAVSTLPSQGDITTPQCYHTPEGWVLPALFITGCHYHTPVLSHPRCYHTLYRWGLASAVHHTGDAITPHYYHTPHVYHTPCRWGPAYAFYHTGDTRYHTPYTISHPCDNFVKSENVITRVYYLG